MNLFRLNKNKYFSLLSSLQYNIQTFVGQLVYVMPNRHQHHTLYNGPNGIVTQCIYCKSVNIVFGNIMLNLEITDFPAFCARVCRCLEKHYHDQGHPRLRYIIMPTFQEGVSFMLTRQELSDMHNVLMKIYPEVDLVEHDKNGFSSMAKRLPFNSN